MLQKQRSSRIFQLTILLALAALPAKGFLCPSPTLAFSSRLVLHQSEPANNDSRLRRSRKKTKQEQTLYDIIGASPKDSKAQLKLRYTALVKSLHPDANPGIDKTTLTYELSEINAAWQVLSDPKERLRYDRSLQAKEFTQGVETLVGLSIKTAIPFLQKTADTTVAAVDASSKAAQKGAEQAKMAYNVLQLQQASRSMEQKAAAERARAAKLQKEMEALPSKRVASLNTGKNVVLTASEAQRLLKAFQVTSPPFMLETDMKALGKTEQDHKESTRVQQLAERAAEQAERALERAQQAEKQAVQRLEEAQKALVQAQAAHGAAQKAREQATAVNLQSRTELEKTEAALQLTSQKVRTGLQQEQEKYLANQASVLKNEAKQAEGTAKELQVEAERLKKEAQELENSQQQ